jgi:hypothetical protein
MGGVRFYLARIVTLALNNLLLVPSALSLLFLLFGFLVEKCGWEKGGLACGRAAGRVERWYTFAWLDGLRAVERWILGTRKPRVENVNG